MFRVAISIAAYRTCCQNTYFVIEYIISVCLFGILTGEVSSEMLPCPRNIKPSTIILTSSFAINFFLIFRPFYTHERIFIICSAAIGKFIKRIPLFLTGSVLNSNHYGAGLSDFKARLGLSSSDHGNLRIMRNTCLNPFQCSENYVIEAGDAFRNAVLNCIGGVSFLLYCH